MHIGQGVNRTCMLDSNETRSSFEVVGVPLARSNSPQVYGFICASTSAREDPGRSTSVEGRGRTYCCGAVACTSQVDKVGAMLELDETRVLVFRNSLNLTKGLCVRVQVERCAYPPQVNQRNLMRRIRVN